MPISVIHCSVCSKSISGYDFAERMRKIRRHYKAKHPRKFKQWGKGKC